MSARDAVYGSTYKDALTEGFILGLSTAFEPRTNLALAIEGDREKFKELEEKRKSIRNRIEDTIGERESSR